MPATSTLHRSPISGSVGSGTGGRASSAAAAGLRFAPEDYQISVTTANGAATAAPARLDSVAVGPIVVHGVRALVARPGALRQSLLGMTFLERLKSFSVEGGKLILKGA